MTLHRRRRWKVPGDQLDAAVKESTAPAAVEYEDVNDRQYFVGRDQDGAGVWSRRGIHMLCCGPSQTGKTKSILSHAVQLSSGATVTTSTKEDFLDLPVGRRTRHVLDLTGDLRDCGLGKLRFSPLTLIHTFEDALLVGRTLMDAAYSFTGSGVTNEAYWTQRGARVVAAIAWAAVQANRPIGEVFDWAAAENTAEPLRYLGGQDAPNRTAHRILEGLLVPDGKGAVKPSQQASAVWSFAQQALSLYAYPDAVERANDPNLVPDDFVKSNDVLHIVCPSSRAGELGAVIAVLVQALVDARYRAHAATSTGVDSPLGRLTLVLDEVANTAPLPLLPAVLSEGAGQGVSVVVGAQDRAQLITRFGEQPARTIVSNCRDRVITSELGDRAFLEDVEALAGKEMRREMAETESNSGQGQVKSTTYTDREVPVWQAWELAQLPRFTGLYLRGWEPELIDLVRWTDRRPSDTQARPRRRPTSM